MRQLAYLAALGCLISCYGMNADAANPTWTTGAVTGDHYVGATTATTDGSTNGIVGMNVLCQAKYGHTAHMCNTDEFFRSAGFAKTTLLPFMWINPVFHDCVFDQNYHYVT